MAAWFLNPALTRFRNEVNDRWPRRDHASDGTIGDAAHQLTNSDHNRDPDGSVDAWDMDVDGADVPAIIAAALRHEAIQYVIYNRRITSRTYGLGNWRPYTGASPHIEHVHFNTREAFENSIKPWFTEGTDMDLNDIKDLMKYNLTPSAAPGQEILVGRALLDANRALVAVKDLAVKVDALAVPAELDYERLARALLKVAAE